MSKQYDYRDENGNFLDYFYLVNELTEYGNEIERLNNIIGKFEEWLIQETIDLYDKDNPLLLDASFTIYATERKMAYMYVLDKLKELKGELNEKG